MLNNYQDLLDTVIETFAVESFPLNLICDHICYRVETQSRYEEIKSLLLKTSELATESLVSGRMISIFTLPTPLIYKNLSIDCLELPAPKSGSHYQEGWEHAEFVVPDLATFIKNHSSLEFNHKAMDREINPELALRISDKFQIKFHPLHILEVIEREKNLP